MPINSVLPPTTFASQWRVSFVLYQIRACCQRVEPNGEKFVPIGTEHNQPHLH